MIVIEPYTCPLCHKWLTEDACSSVNGYAVYFCGKDYHTSHYKVGFRDFKYRREYLIKNIAVYYDNNIPYKASFAKIMTELDNGKNKKVLRHFDIPINKPMSVEDILKKVERHMLLL